MTQLILDSTGVNIALPESRQGGYKCYKEPLGEEIEMISGRVVREIRGSLWICEYEYEYLPDVIMKKVLQACEKGRREPITCSFLTHDGILTSRFYVNELQRPEYIFARVNAEGVAVPVWSNMFFSLREVKPND